MRINYLFYVSLLERMKWATIIHYLIGIVFALILGPVNKSSDQVADSDVSSSTPNKSEQVQSLTQLILSLDMEQWETLVQVFDIRTAMIQH